LSIDGKKVDDLLIYLKNKTILRMKKISFILPIFNESGNIPKLWKELQILQKSLTKYEIEYIFVDDFSTDDSFAQLESISKSSNKSVIVLKFSRNFGHQIAVTAGQDIATGDVIIIMDTDLQDPPSVCIDLVKKWEEGYEVVYAQRKTYKSSFAKKLPAFLFYRLMKNIANVDIPVDTGDFRLISKRVNDEMKKYKEKSRFLRGISSLVGMKQTAVLFDRGERFSGKPGYTFGKSLKLAFDGITGFSVAPLRLISFTGALIAICGFLFGLGYIIWALYTKNAIVGWSSVMSSIYFLGGIQLIMTGIIGEYIGRIYIQTIDRPLYTIEQVVSSKIK
jgi:polyisoprenyl-phosphate glycosyltransferase